MNNKNTDYQKQKFTISYEGEALKSHSMSVEDLAPALLALDKIFQISNTLLNGHNSNVHLKVVGQKSGSFEVVLDLFQNLPEIMSIIKTHDSKELLYILFGSAGFFAYLKSLKNMKKPVKQLNESQDINITGNFHNCVFNFYNNNEIKKESKIFLKPLSKAGIKQLNISENKKLLNSINKEDVDYFLQQSDEEVTNETTNNFTKYYHIIALTFEKGKWKLSDNNSTITAKIRDEAFIKKVESSRLSFSKGDILKCKVREEQKEINGNLKSSYFIEKVLEHTPFSSKQLKLL